MASWLLCRGPHTLYALGYNHMFERGLQILACVLVVCYFPTVINKFNSLRLDLVSPTTAGWTAIDTPHLAAVNEADYSLLVNQTWNGKIFLFREGGRNMTALLVVDLASETTWVCVVPAVSTVLR